MNGRILTAALALVFLFAPLISWAHHDQLVAGAGPSTKVTELFFQEFSKNPACKDYNFNVMSSSIKHRGGILSSDKYYFGRTGRPLNAKEKAQGKAEIILGTVPITFATGLESEGNYITLEQLKKIYTRQITNWKEVGGKDAPILLVGREETEALFLTLKEKYPFFRKVTFDKIFKRDGDVVSFLKSPAGAYAIAFGAKPNFQLYTRLPVEGFSAGVPVGLVYDLNRKDNPVIQAAIEYAASPEWKSKLSTVDMLPVD